MMPCCNFSSLKISQTMAPLESWGRGKVAKQHHTKDYLKSTATATRVHPHSRFDENKMFDLEERKLGLDTETVKSNDLQEKSTKKQKT